MAVADLLQRQKKLSFKVINFDLEKSWHSNKLIKFLRKKVLNNLPKGLYDPQDLEHQVLFRLTTFDPAQITDKLINDVIEEQYSLVKERINKLSSKFDIEYIFRGLSGRYHDLNVFHRMVLTYDKDGKIKAVNKNHSLSVEFKKIEDEDIINLFSNDLHYIHKKRAVGEVFGLFFVGDAIPWCIETTEPSLFVKEYKREALLAYGILYLI